MPYIKQEDRQRFMWIEDQLKDHWIIQTPGDLQYLIALAIRYMPKTCYQEMNDIMGALAGAQMEFYRRTVAPYEDKKCHENGDV